MENPSKKQNMGDTSEFNKTHFSNELLVQIFKRLDLKTLARASYVSHSWNDIATIVAKSTLTRSNLTPNLLVQWIEFWTRIRFVFIYFKTYDKLTFEI